MITDDSHIRVIGVYKRHRSYTALMSLDTQTYGRIMKRGKLNIGWSSCRVYEHFSNVQRCFKCCRCSHYARDSNADVFVCPRCGKEHEIKDCDSEVEMCANCVETNIKVTRNNRWFSTELSELRRHRNLTQMRAEYTNDWNEYRISKNKYNYEVRRARNDDLKATISRLRSDPEKLWSGIKKIMDGPKQTKRSMLFDDLQENDESVIAQKLNDFFIQSIESINESIPYVPYVESRVNYREQIPAWNEFTPISRDELWKIICRAFETLERYILIRRLIAIGVGGKVLTWFTTWLMNRHQRTRFYEKISERKSIDIAVPQGTPLSCALFNVYINDIPQIVAHSRVNMFADDTMMWVAGTDINTLISNLTQDVANLSEYL